MAARIRFLTAANRSMQRVGFLKLLCEQARRIENNTLASLGQEFIHTITKRIRLSPPFSEPFREYVKNRLTDRLYHDLRKAVLEESETATRSVGIEVQDLYLSDPRLPSATGKLVDNDWKHYPRLTTALDLVKPGTYSAMVRALVLLALTPAQELKAFEDYNGLHNPLFISREQAALVLYCFIENDAAMTCPLFQRLLALADPIFDERIAGDMLPDVIRQSVGALRGKLLTVQDRERIAQVEQVSINIAKQRDKPYTGGGARENYIRARLEPYCDLGLLVKPDKNRFIYEVTPAFRSFVDNWADLGAIDVFLDQRFFSSLGTLHDLQLRDASDEEAQLALEAAGQQIKSTLGYSPIKDVALLAGIRLLFERQVVLEIHTTTRILKEWQKEAPDVVRFSVDRMGELAYVKFLKPLTAPPGTKRP